MWRGQHLSRLWAAPRPPVTTPHTQMPLLLSHPGTPARSCAQAALTKSRRAGDLSNRHLRLTALEDGRPRSSSQQGHSLPGPISLACRWPASNCVLTWSPSLCFCPNLFFSKSGFRATLMTSFHTHYLFNDPSPMTVPF
jgi:hypothetical protein